jgi:hypothetical protein
MNSLVRDHLKFRKQFSMLGCEGLLSYEGVDEGPPTHERARLAELKALVDRSRE